MTKKFLFLSGVIFYSINLLLQLFILSCLSDPRLGPWKLLQVGSYFLVSPSIFENFLTEQDSLGSSYTFLFPTLESTASQRALIPFYGEQYFLSFILFFYFNYLHSSLLCVSFLCYPDSFIFALLLFCFSEVFVFLGNYLSFR